MALRSVATRRVGVQALRQASSPFVSPSAGSDGSLASSSSQAGYSNWTEIGAARKMRSVEIKRTAEMEKNVGKGIDEEIAKMKASFQKAREAIEEGRRNEAKVAVCSSAVGFALAVYTFLAFNREVMNIIEDVRRAARSRS